MPSPDEVIISAKTPLGFVVTVDARRWGLIVSVKHPVMVGKEHEIDAVLRDPDEIRRSRSDPNVLLFYKRVREKRWCCAVVKRNGVEAFLITAYPTDAIKEGLRTWPS